MMQNLNFQLVAPNSFEGLLMQSLISSRCLRSFESIHLCCIITDEGFVFTKQNKAKEKEKNEKKKKKERKDPKIYKRFHRY